MFCREILVERIKTEMFEYVAFNRRKLAMAAFEMFLGLVILA